MGSKGENVVLAPVGTVGNAIAAERDEGEFRFHDLFCFLILACVKIVFGVGEKRSSSIVHMKCIKQVELVNLHIR